jgi:hypothetical protein
MARPKLGPNRQPWKGIDANERAYNTVHNALVGIILDGVTGVSPDLGHRQIAPEKADEYLDRARRVLADFESQAIAPGGARGRAQRWMDGKIDQLRRLLTDAEAVRAGKRPQKMTPESYGELRKHLGLAERGMSRHRPTSATMREAHPSEIRDFNVVELVIANGTEHWVPYARGVTRGRALVIVDQLRKKGIKAKIEHASVR